MADPFEIQKASKAETRRINYSTAGSVAGVAVGTGAGIAAGGAVSESRARVKSAKNAVKQTYKLDRGLGSNKRGSLKTAAGFGRSALKTSHGAGRAAAGSKLVGGYAGLLGGALAGSVAGDKLARRKNKKLKMSKSDPFEIEKMMQRPSLGQGMKTTAGIQPKSMQLAKPQMAKPSDPGGTLKKISGLQDTKPKVGGLGKP